MERYYEDLRVGDEHESPGRTITETDIVNFSAISGDWSPIHTDEEYCKGSPYKTRIAHGLLGLAISESLRFRIPAFADVRYMASLYWNYKFTGPILIGDSIRVRVKIASKRETKPTRKAAQPRILSGSHAPRCQASHKQAAGWTTREERVQWVH